LLSPCFFLNGLGFGPANIADSDFRRQLDGPFPILSGKRSLRLGKPACALAEVQLQRT
jgi:hypothetical protein